MDVKHFSYIKDGTQAKVFEGEYLGPRGMKMGSREGSTIPSSDNFLT